MKTSDILKMIQIASTFCGAYDDHGFNDKKAFHRLATAYLKEFAGVLGLARGSYDVRSNKAGVACLGEVTLHGEGIYIQLSQSSLGEQFMYRKCKGRKDYTGGVNQWMALSQLADITEAGRIIRNHMER